MERRLIGIKEAAEYLDIKSHTLYTWVSQRRIPFVKCGRLTKFDLRDVEKFINENKVDNKSFI